MPRATVVRIGDIFSPPSTDRVVSDTVHLGDSATGFANPPTDEPEYTGSNLIFAGDAASPLYADLTASGALVGGTPGSVPRLFPVPSPVSNYLFGTGSTIDTVKHAITTGIGGVGKAVRLVYPPNAGPGQIAPYWVLYVPEATLLAIPAGATIVMQMWERYTGSLITGTAIKCMKGPWYRDEPFGAGYPQFSTQNGPAPASSSSGKHTYRQFMDRSHQDGVSPTGNQATQPFGPYWEDEFDGNFRRVTYSYKPNASLANRNGHARRWQDSIKIVDQSLATAGVTPSGGEKPWCTDDALNYMERVDQYASVVGASQVLFELGGVMSTPLPTAQSFGIDYDIDTFLVWWIAP